MGGAANLIAEPNLNALSALISVVIFFVTLRLLPRLHFPLQKRALRFFLLATFLFFVAQVLEVLEKSSELLSLLPTVDVTELAYIICTSLAVYYLFRSEREELALLRRAADLDDLTALHNRSFLRRAANRRFEQSKKGGLPLSCVLLDIDDFKPYNDRFGHESGDNALRCVARVLREAVRADDLMARYGGEEFVLVMNSGPGGAAMVAERVRSGVESWCTPQRNNSLYRQITVSLGVASMTNEMASFDELVVAADQQMYHAKRAGKNRVSVI